MKLGDILKQQRESKGLTTQAVADAIHLSHKQVNALETNDFSVLPEPVTTRGFIRSYAKFLEIDAEPLLSNYRELVPHQDANSIVMNTNVNEVIAAESQPPWMMYILGSIVVLLLLVVWFYYMDNVEDWASDSEPEITLDAQMITEDAVEPSSSNVVTLDAPVDSTAGGWSAPVEPDVIDEPVVDLTSPLTISVKDACWVSIKTMDGKNFFEKLLPAGSEESFAIKAPFKLKIGNASEAKASYLNIPIDLAANTKHNVARLTVNKQATVELQANVADVASTSLVENPLQPAINEDLVIMTTEACWVSVKTLGGKKIFEQLLPAGAKQGVNAQKPFKLIIGNASAAQALYQGQPLDLMSNKKHNVAHVSVK